MISQNIARTFTSQQQRFKQREVATDPPLKACLEENDDDLRWTDRMGPGAEQHRKGKSLLWRLPMERSMIRPKFATQPS